MSCSFCHTAKEECISCGCGICEWHHDHGTCMECVKIEYIERMLKPRSLILHLKELEMKTGKWAISWLRKWGLWD